MKAEIVLTTALETAEIAPTAAALRRSPAIVRSIGSVRAPLNLHVLPFRYRIRAGKVQAVTPRCRHRVTR